MKKSELEIGKIARVCGIVSQTFSKADAILHEGQSLTETFRAFRRQCLADGADDVPYLVGGAGRGGYRDVISPPTDLPLRRGDILMLDTGSVFDGYFATSTATLRSEKPTMRRKRPMICFGARRKPALRLRAPAQPAGSFINR